jgi:hypothetical protein
MVCVSFRTRSSSFASSSLQTRKTRRRLLRAAGRRHCLRRARIAALHRYRLRSTALHLLRRAALHHRWSGLGLLPAEQSTRANTTATAMETTARTGYGERQNRQNQYLAHDSPPRRETARARRAARRWARQPYPTPTDVQTKRDAFWHHAPPHHRQARRSPQIPHRRNPRHRQTKHASTPGQELPSMLARLLHTACRL